uniref:Reverse transcriptase domain-containing protein n=1 Tax=Tanacetum cinerariifolium TaxID=118510 RepID=A0A6L2PAM4_TANCI|nr:hypothetical protein [Tanacetum cinerariifolium]
MRKMVHPQPALPPSTLSTIDQWATTSPSSLPSSPPLSPPYGPSRKRCRSPTPSPSDIPSHMLPSHKRVRDAPTANESSTVVAARVLLATGETVEQIIPLLVMRITHHDRAIDQEIVSLRARVGTLEHHDEVTKESSRIARDRITLLQIRVVVTEAIRKTSNRARLQSTKMTLQDAESLHARVEAVIGHTSPRGRSGSHLTRVRHVAATYQSCGSHVASTCHHMVADVAAIMAQAKVAKPSLSQAQTRDLLDRSLRGKLVPTAPSREDAPNTWGEMDQEKDLLVGDTMKDSGKSADKGSDSINEIANVLGTLGAENILASRGLRSVFTTASLSVATASTCVSSAVATTSGSFPTAAIFTTTSARGVEVRLTVEIVGIKPIVAHAVVVLLTVEIVRVELSYNQNFGDNYYPQNSSSFPQQYLCCKNCEGPRESFQCQPRNQNYFEPNPCYDSNSSGFDQPLQYTIDHQEDINQQRMNDVDDRWNKMIESGNKIIQLLGEMILQQKQVANLKSTIYLRDIISQLPPSIVITTSPPVLPIENPDDSLIMGNEELSTIPEKETEEIIKYSVEDFVPIPSEFEDTSGSDSECDLPSCNDFSPEGKSVTFSNPLFDSNDDFTFSDDESLSDEDVPEDNVKIYLNPLFEFDDEYISSDVNPLFDEVLEDIKSKSSCDSNLDEPALQVTPLSDCNEDECFDQGGDVDEINAFDIPSDFEDGYYDSKGHVLYLESLLNDDTTPNLPPEVFLDHNPRNLMDSSLPLSSGSDDIIFDPGIFAFHFSSLEPMTSHQSGTFMCFNVYPNILNESPMEICSSTRFNPNITII